MKNKLNGLNGLRNRSNVSKFEIRTETVSKSVNTHTHTNLLGAYWSYWSSLDSRTVWQTESNHWLVQRSDGVSFGGFMAKESPVGKESPVASRSQAIASSCKLYKRHPRDPL